MERGIPASLVLLTLSAAPVGVLRQGSAAPAPAAAPLTKAEMERFLHHASIIHQKGHIERGDRAAPG